MLPDSFLQELKMRNDIIDVISSYVKLKRNGRNMSGLCPFHREKTPSFFVYVDTQSFYCFGCGSGGDVINFIMKAENLDYIDAVKFLAKRAGLNMPSFQISDQTSKLKLRIYEVNREAARFFHNSLISDPSKTALEYLHSRGLSDSIIKRFGLGFAPDSRFALSKYLKGKGFNDKELVAANLSFISRNGNLVDRFYNRVMFPIIDVRANVIAFGGRCLNDDKPKYLNTSDTVVFKKSDNLFALNLAKKSKSDMLILAEGYMDVIALHQSGFSETVATLGTALTQQQARIISRYSQEVVICYDSDEAGQKATMRAIPILRSEGLKVRVLKLKDAKDPDEYIKKFKRDGALRFRKLLENSGNDIEYRIQKIKDACDINTNTGKIEFLNKVCELLSTVNNKFEREIYSSQIAEEISVSSNLIKEQINKIIKKRLVKDEKKQVLKLSEQLTLKNDKLTPDRSKNLKAASAEESLIAFIFASSENAKEIIDKVSSEEFITEFNKKIYSSIEESLKIKEGVELQDFRSKFSDEEMNRLSKILALGSGKITDMEQANRYITIIKCEYEKKVLKQASSVDADDIDKYMELLRQQKNRRN